MTDPLSQTLRPNIQAFLNFAEGELFGPEYCEHITRVGHLDALEQMLDESKLPEVGDVAAWLTTQEEFWTIAAYKRYKVTDNQADDWADHIVENLRDGFADEYGNEDGDDGLSDEDVVALKQIATNLVRFYTERAVVYRCEQLRTFRFDSADMLELVQQLRPDWLNKVGGGDV